MPKRKAWIFDPMPLRSLIDKTGVSIEAASASTGISLSSMNGYLRGKSNPGTDALMALADYFAVPMDFLLGRLDADAAGAVLKDYGAHFMELRRAPWEAYLAGRRNIPSQYMGYTTEAPYPYNLLDDIVGGIDWGTHEEESSFWCDIVTGDQEAGLCRALSSLTDRERLVLSLYYERGLNLEDAGKELNVTRERIRQIIAKALRKLRHPSRFRMIRLGLQGSELESENKKLRSRLEAERFALESAYRSLDFLREALFRRAEALQNASGNFIVFQNELLSGPPVKAEKESLLYMTVDEMDLSVRSFNCLKRAGIDNLGELVDRLRLGQEGGLTKVRSLGRKSLDEILNRVMFITGEDYRPLYYGDDTA